MTMSDYGMRSLARAPADPLPIHCRRFSVFISALQASNNGSPVVVTPADIRWCLWIQEADQIRVRQALMRAGVLRLSDCNGRWGYSVDA